MEEDGARLQEDGARLHEDGARLDEDRVKLHEDGSRVGEVGDGSNEEGVRVDGDEWREDLEAAEAKGCDNRGTLLRIATYNAGNHFARPSVMRCSDWAKGRGAAYLLGACAG